MKQNTLSDEELVEKIDEWNRKLCKTSGRAWSRRVPPNPNEDPDLLIAELCKRFEVLKASVSEMTEAMKEVIRVSDRNHPAWDRAKQIIEQVSIAPYGLATPLCADFFQKYGFSEPIRYWNEKWQQFSIYYKIEGYDCDILVRPFTQVTPNGYNAYGDGVHEMPPEIQVDHFSDIKMLENHHTGDFQIFVNSLENHVATFNYEFQMIDFMSICGCPLS